MSHEYRKLWEWHIGSRDIDPASLITCHETSDNNIGDECHLLMNQQQLRFIGKKTKDMNKIFTPAI